MGWFTRRKERITTATDKKKETPDGLWSKCTKCKNIVTTEEYKQNLFCCITCNYHKTELANELDQKDPLKSYRDHFYYPKGENGEEVLYLCGNSLGLQPKYVRSFVEMELNAWEKDGVLGQHGRWENFHEKLMANSARLVGAIPSEVVVMNALTVNINLLFL